MLVSVCLLWSLFHCVLGGPTHRATRSEEINPINVKQDGAPQSFHRLPMFLHAPGPLIRPELFLPVPQKTTLPTGLPALLLPATSQPQTTQGTGDRAVEVWCGTDAITVRLDRLQLRTWTDPSLFRLGSCAATRISPRFLYFHSRLTECGGEFKVAGGQLVYTYSLNYIPPPQGYVIRVLPLNLPIYCHYNRFLYSYKVGFRPQVPHKTFLKTIRSKLIFSITVCNAQWEPLPAGHWFFLGEPVYFLVQTEALLNGERLYVDSCYASSSKDPNSMPKVDIIANYGCMTDSRREGSSSKFLSRQDNVLKFSVDSFLFKPVSEVQYLHCSVSVGLTTSHNAKSCNYKKHAGRWEELEASPSVCSCCDSTCSDMEDSSKNTVSSPGWFIRSKGEEKPRMTVVSVQAHQEKKAVDQEENRKERMDVHLKEVQTFPRQFKISHIEEEDEILPEKEDWKLAAVSQWEKNDKEDKMSETKMFIMEKADSQLKELATDSTIMSDESRQNEPAQVREEVPYSKNVSVIGLFSDNSGASTSRSSFSNTNISTTDSSYGIIHKTSNHDSAEDVSTAMVPTICDDSEKISCSAANSAVQHEKSSDGVGHGTRYVAVSEDSFSPYNVRSTSSTARLGSVWDSSAHDGLYSSRWETVAGKNSDSPGFPGVVKSRKSRLQLDKLDTVLWSEQINRVNKSVAVDTMSDKILEQVGGSVNSKGSDRDHVEHIRGSESDRSAHPAGCRDLICAGLFGKSDSDSGSEKGEALRLSQFTGKVQTEEDISGITQTHSVSSSSVGSEQMQQDSPSHSAVVTVITALQDSERRQMTNRKWAEVVSG
ncbi:uncharacterized protein LOC111569450 [Amphiprion ocellaris]|uniref:ZP domain-containing protein n=1 Tax=Amphiprion ocellaris TaxID=80972 RepID=A0A3Q1CV36_AMPOC|nr:uncharacterized protein LOC111569450 [Amphiprion ocellaris]